MQNHGCDCGAFNASAAGYRQMSAEQRRHFDQQARDCKTCRADRAPRRRRLADIESEALSKLEY